MHQTACPTLTDTPRARRTRILIRADRLRIPVVQCTFVGDYSQRQCMHNAAPGSDRCAGLGHERQDGAAA